MGGGGVTPSYREDGIVWRWHKKGTFTVKSTYKVISDGGLREYISLSVWRLCMSPRMDRWSGADCLLSCRRIGGCYGISEMELSSNIAILIHFSQPARLGEFCHFG